MIQGASKKGHYMYHYVSEKIQEITGSESLINQYGVLMSINDSLYWQLSDETMQMMMGGGEGEPQIGGKESVDRETDPPTIVARGVNFPILVHELIKGVMELLAIQGRPKDEEGNEADFTDIPHHLHQTYFQSLISQYNTSVSVYSNTKDDEPKTIKEQKSEWRSNRIVDIISKAIKK